MAPATPPPSSKSLFAAFTMASVSISVRSPCWIMIFCASSVEIILLFSLFAFVAFFPFLRLLVLGIGKFPSSFVGLIHNQIHSPAQRPFPSGGPPRNKQQSSPRTFGSLFPAQSSAIPRPCRKTACRRNDRRKT